MAIFNNTTFSPVVEQTDDQIVEMYPHIMPTAESAYEIACEGYHDIHKLISSLYISDILIENAVFEGASDPEVLVENAVKEFIDKAVKKFKEIKDKVIAWFKKIIADLKIRFADSKTFVVKYEDKIVEKAKLVGSNYKPMQHSFNTDVHGKANEIIRKVFDYAVKSYTDKDLNVGSFVDGMYKHLGGSNMSDVKEKFVKSINGGEAKKATLDSSKVSSMISYCKDVSVKIAEIEKLKKDSEKEIDNIISLIKQSNKEVTVVKSMVSAYNSALSVMQQINAISVTMINSINKEYIANLRGLLLFKPAKESVETSLFESAMNLF